MRVFENRELGCKQDRVNFYDLKWYFEPLSHGKTHKNFQGFWNNFFYPSVELGRESTTLSQHTLTDGTWPNIIYRPNEPPEKKYSSSAYLQCATFIVGQYFFSDAQKRYFFYHNKKCSPTFNVANWICVNLLLVFFSPKAKRHPCEPDLT